MINRRGRKVFTQMAQRGLHLAYFAIRNIALAPFAVSFNFLVQLQIVPFSYK